MSEEQRWNPSWADADRFAGGTALTLEHDDGVSLDPAAHQVSVRLTDTGELPFLQPRPGDFAVESGPGWIDRLATLGRRPATIVVAATVAGLIFAAFVTNTDQGGPSPNDGVASDRPELGNPGSDVDAVQSVDGAVADDGVVLKSSVADEQVGRSGPVSRSSGDTFEAGGDGVLTVQVVEPAAASTTPSTIAPRATTATPTTAAPTTAEPATTSEATTTTAEPTTTSEATTTTAEATTTTAEPTTTTAEPTTTIEDRVAEIDGVRLEARAPGSADAGNAPSFRPGDIVLRAEGSENIIAYRFRIYIQDDEEWERVDSSGWRLRRQYDTRFARYEGRIIRWTVEGRTIDGTRTPPTPPLHIYVDSDR